MKTYKLISTKGTDTFTGAHKDAITAAIAMEERLQPAFGVTVEVDGETVAEIRDGINTTDEANPLESFTDAELLGELASRGYMVGNLVRQYTSM